MGFIETAYSGNATLKDLDINADLNLKGEYDAIGINKFICSDYMGALQTSVGDSVKYEIPITADISSGNFSPRFRVPSNFVGYVHFRIIMDIYGGNSQFYLQKYNSETDTYSDIYLLFNHGTQISGDKYYFDYNNNLVNAGDILRIRVYGSSKILSSSPIQIAADYQVYNGAIWSNPDE